MLCRNSSFQPQPLNASLYTHHISSEVCRAQTKPALCVHTHPPQHPGLIPHSRASISRQPPKLAALGRSLLLLLRAHNGLFTEGSSLPIVHPWPDVVRERRKRTGEQLSAPSLQGKQPQEPTAFLSPCPNTEGSRMLVRKASSPHGLGAATLFPCSYRKEGSFSCSSSHCELCGPRMFSLGKAGRGYQPPTYLWVRLSC